MGCFYGSALCFEAKQFVSNSDKEGMSQKDEERNCWQKSVCFMTLDTTAASYLDRTERTLRMLASTLNTQSSYRAHVSGIDYLLLALFGSLPFWSRTVGRYVRVFEELGSGPSTEAFKRKPSEFCVQRS